MVADGFCRSVKKRKFCVRTLTQSYAVESKGKKNLADPFHTNTFLSIEGTNLHLLFAFRRMHHMLTKKKKRSALVMVVCSRGGTPLSVRVLASRSWKGMHETDYKWPHKSQNPHNEALFYTKCAFAGACVCLYARFFLHLPVLLQACACGLSVWAGETGMKGPRRRHISEALMPFTVTSHALIIISLLIHIRQSFVANLWSVIFFVHLHFMSDTS